MFVCNGMSHEEQWSKNDREPLFEVNNSVSFVLVLPNVVCKRGLITRQGREIHATRERQMDPQVNCLNIAHEAQAVYIVKC